MEFIKYQHIERFGTDETEGIEIGTCHIFPKIDGTNSSIWLSNNKICCGSRNREVSLEEDNQGFMAYIIQQENVLEFFLKYPLFRLYCEWLVPHSLKTYRKEAWNKFYVFDVMDSEGELLHYDIYSKMLDEFNITYIPPLAIINNPTYENLINKLPGNVYLIEDGKGSGEGIVIKNFNYKNKFGRQTWAKIVTSEFKEKNVREMGVKATDGSKQIELEIVEKYCTQALVDKVYAKIASEMDGWRSQYIPRLLQTVFYDLVNEEAWNFVKEFKLPTINFRTLSFFCNNKIKELKKELF